MLTLRKAQDRGHADHGWLNSHHSFSFADYHDPAHMGFGNLRVLNDDTVARRPGLRHARPSRHGDHQLRAGRRAGAPGLDGQRHARRRQRRRDRAGRRAAHDRRHRRAPQRVQPLEGLATHFLQIWILPERGGITPGYEQVNVPEPAKRGKLALVGAPDKVPGAVTLNADARIFAGLFDGAERQELPLPAGRLTYVHVARGSLRVNGQQLGAGDALKIRDEATLVLEGGDKAEVLVFDLKP